MNLLIFGTGVFWTNRKNSFSKENIVGFIDNNPVKWGQEVDGIKIVSPRNINEFEYEYICLMGNATNALEMRKQLIEMKIPYRKIIDYFEYTQMKLRKEDRQRSCVIFGTGIYYRNRRSIFEDVNIVCYADNDEHKWNTVFENKIIIEPSLLLEVEADYICIMANDHNKREIVAQLMDMGLPSEKIIDYSKAMLLFGIAETEQEQIANAFFMNNEEPGRELHRSLQMVDSDDPLVTIITPYYNAGKYFEQTFNCIMNQTFPWFEWIIINDGSTNKKDIEVLDKFAQKDRRIRVVNQYNLGQAGARNTGFSNAKTDIVVQVDADDLIAPQYLEYIYWGLYYNPDASWAYTWNVGFQEQSYLWKKPWNAELLKTENFLTAFAGVRKSAWKEIGGYKIEEFLYNEDWRFWLDMLAEHKKPVCLGGYLSWYRRSDNSMLAGLKSDEERQLRSDAIIKNAAARADGTIQAKEYPVNDTEHLYRPICQVNWDKKRVIPKNSAIRILIVLPWMVMGGADKFALDVVAGLTEKGYEISIFTTLPSENEWKYRFAEYTDDIYNLPEFLEMPFYAEYTEYYIKSRQIDVIMVSNSSNGYYMLPYLREKFPQLVIFDYVHMEEWYWRAGGHARTSGALGEITEITYVCNNATREVMINDFRRNEKSVKTLHIGVDEKYFDEKNVNHGYLYSLCGITEDRPIVLFPCRIHQQKRPFLMLQIAKRIVSVRPDVVFVVVGDGPELYQVKEEIYKEKLSDNIICIGQSNNMRACYKDAKITLICSLKEGLTLTAYESLSMGVPVISSDVGGQRDLIDDNVGRLIPMKQLEAVSLNNREFDSSEINEYVHAILEILDNEEEYKKLCENCRNRIVMGFSVHHMVEKLDKEILQMYEDIEMSKKRKNMSELLQEIPSLSQEIFTLGTVLK